ncbi:MAG: hypothetical protein ABIQ09_12440 [Jatrophihabitantaceae bacterium]
MTFAADNIDFLAEQLASPRHEAAARGADVVLAELGIGYRTLPYAFRVDAQELADLERATVLLADAQNTLLSHLVAQHSPEDLSAMFSVPGPMAAQLDWPTVATRNLRALRADIIPTDTGYAFCEVNHFCAVGGCDAYYSAIAYADLLGQPMAGVSPMRQLAVQYADAMLANGWTRFVILDSSKHRPQGFGEHVMLQRFLHWLLPEVEIHYCDELTFPQRWLASSEAERTLVHRLATYEDTDDEGALLVRLRDSGIAFSCMFEAELRMHRRWFSMLCDPAWQRLLREEEVEAIRRFVPHTFDLSPDRLDEVIADKDELVFKRSWSYGGKGVLVGAEYDTDHLRKLLTADTAGWNCQQRVRAEILDVTGLGGHVRRTHFVLGMFLYGDGPSGLLVRGSEEAVVNVSRGGGVSWAFAT